MDTSRFLDALSHDVRQPLQALLLYLGALERRIHDDEARALLAQADRAAASLASICDALALYSKLDAGKITAEIEDVALVTLFAEVAARHPNVTAVASHHHVSSDPALLGLILDQYASNASRHGGGGARLAAEERDGAIEISISDSGPGVAATDHDRIFEEFTRLEGARPDGVGLGLANARTLADLLGHSLEVRSAPGQGAAFIVRAPRA